MVRTDGRATVRPGNSELRFMSLPAAPDRRNRAVERSIAQDAGTGWFGNSAATTAARGLPRPGVVPSNLVVTGCLGPLDCGRMPVRYVGKLYRPPSEADALILQATIGCSWNHCTYCDMYRDKPEFRIRPLAESLEALADAARELGAAVEKVFVAAPPPTMSRRRGARGRLGSSCRRSSCSAPAGSSAPPSTRQRRQRSPPRWIRTTSPH
jgi:hypothetical protein